MGRSAEIPKWGAVGLKMGGSGAENGGSASPPLPLNPPPLRHFLPPPNRRKHIAALLDVRGLRSPSARQEILGVLQDVGTGEAEVGPPPPPRERAFFSELPVVWRPRCLPFDLQRLAGLRLRGLRSERRNEGRL